MTPAQLGLTALVLFAGPRPQTLIAWNESRCALKDLEEMNRGIDNRCAELERDISAWKRPAYQEHYLRSEGYGKRGDITILLDVHS